VSLTCTDMVSQRTTSEALACSLEAVSSLSSTHDARVKSERNSRSLLPL
jgi:hypothetical protein